MGLIKKILGKESSCCGVKIQEVKESKEECCSNEKREEKKSDCC